ncbi:DUF6252 family protein [Winogradskyella forsetii]|uniref:DUF6252 family protein n=1 Tax=Winogradskyella forsetii TaxID=2686077 RepID=UPI0015BCD99D|nr:DUF6252 family protein [Winogradskyella forsetii]
MKVLKTMCVLVLLILMVSCSSEDDSSNNQNPITEPFFVKINGEDFVPLQIEAVLTAGTINIEGINTEGVDVIIGFSSDFESGDVLNAGLFGTNGTDIFVPIYDTDNGGFFATSGILTITAHNRDTNEISGRFNFSGPDPDDSTSTLNFTEGEFMVTYTEQ